ncbi:RNA 2',3'-cyclic phosphodiesterase [Nocardioides alcanivorans]|uniref:RNA 2',3'-cyclic phosphodiesterase n=1 Tax=Nocardioides alcanivorans TaxID=2897352 RepID=UPI001F1771E3|nr:RNA 2',3'-cyclic phosphodiesterase [Nocardioides alcanivorans]
MRLFAAVVPPGEVVEDLDFFLEARRAVADFRWTDSSQFHVTLAFMADAEEWRVDDYVSRLAGALDGSAAPELRLSGAVAFPHVAGAKVLAARVDSDFDDDLAALDALAVRTRNAAVRSGIEVDGAGFRPHVTVARVRRPMDVTRWFQLLETYDGPAWSVDHVAVIASHLGEGRRGAPRHEVVAQIPSADPPIPLVESVTRRSSPYAAGRARMPVVEPVCRWSSLYAGGRACRDPAPGRAGDPLVELVETFRPGCRDPAPGRAVRGNLLAGAARRAHGPACGLRRVGARRGQAP